MMVTTTMMMMMGVFRRSIYGFVLTFSVISDIIVDVDSQGNSEQEGGDSIASGSVVFV